MYTVQCPILRFIRQAMHVLFASSPAQHSTEYPPFHPDTKRNTSIGLEEIGVEELEMFHNRHILKDEITIITVTVLY